MQPDAGAVRPPCGTCGDLRDFERGFQRGGREEEDSFLPAAAGRLRRVREINSFSTLMQCPECGTFYLLKSYYEFLVSGSEDEQILIRLGGADEAVKHADYWSS